MPGYSRYGGRFRRRRFTHRSKGFKRSYGRRFKASDTTFRSYGWAQKNYSRGDFYVAEYMKVATYTIAGPNAKPALLNASIADVDQAKALAANFQQHKIVDFEATVTNAQIVNVSTKTPPEASVVVDPSPLVAMAPFPNTSNYASGVTQQGMSTMRNCVMKRVTATTPLTVKCVKPVLNINTTLSNGGPGSSALANQWCTTANGITGSFQANYTGILVGPPVLLAPAPTDFTVQFQYQVIQKYKVYFRKRLMGGRSAATPGVEISDPTTATANEEVDAHCEMEGSPSHPLGVVNLEDYALDMYTVQAIASDIRFNHWASDIWSKLSYTRQDWLALPKEVRSRICAKVNGASKLKRAMMEQADAEYSQA